MIRLKPQIGQKVRLRIAGHKVRGTIVRVIRGGFIINCVVAGVGGYFVIRKPEEVKVLS